MNVFHPGEDDLHAYLDGQLDAEQRQAVEAYLAANPEAAAQVEAWRRDAQALRAALASPGLAPNPRLDPRAIRRSMHARKQRRLALAASFVLALGAGGIGGWQARDMSLAAANPPMQDALQAHRLFSASPVVDIQVTRPGELQAWLDQRFSHAARIPDLSPYGFNPVGGRWLVTEQGAAALLLFEDGQGQRVSLYLRAPGSLYPSMKRGQRRDGELEARYWSRDGYNYALVSREGDPRGDVLGRALSF
ncbi:MULTISPECIES: anti-sigma factor [unclassified Pseudomonas]|jgi:anti-sigma factor RsiW|uniref:anti-sigma factor family protein n=1 Tax=unclassified Pseudomonas TaxID=196821 RepID=UPI000EA94815|nr:MULTISPECIES: anti-sigma factor [unclassified Pseudomonas]AYF86984.1 anti-sigma factor [Pseudomonas sp. DY-1]MDH4651903.1 anti-sigma factor [Pseudomonas sp. BN606]MRK23979.1 anti-sigma factor [Pseudomonas sp. JG-B]